MGARARDKGLLAVLPLTSGVEALLVIYATLSPEEQEEAHSRLRTLRVEAQSDAEREMETYLRSLRRVAEAVGHTPGVPEYKKISATLREQGEDIEPFSRLYRYFGGSWARAQEALELSRRDADQGHRSALRESASRQAPALLRGRTAQKHGQLASSTSAGFPARETIPGGGSGGSNLLGRSAGTVCTCRRTDPIASGGEAGSRRSCTSATRRTPALISSRGERASSSRRMSRTYPTACRWRSWRPSRAAQCR